jgi:hypothetical protein
MSDQTPRRRQSPSVLFPRVDALTRMIEEAAIKADRIASDASYVGTELQSAALLSIGSELRNLAQEAQACR